jgi:hypothetical protein
MLRHKAKIYLTGAAIALIYFVLAPAIPVAAAGAISQSYATDSKDVAKGALISATAGRAGNVELANSTTNVSKLLGIAADKSLVEFTTEGKANIQVVTSGTAQALVSDINGSVKAGDKITASPVSGIGMKAIFATEVVGTAQADLSSVTTVKQQVAGLEGNQEQISVGLLPVSVGIGYYSPPGGAGNAASFVPGILQSLANTVAGRPVSPVRVLFATAIMLLGFAIAGMMLNTAIRGGMTSIGRNPLAERVVRQGVREIVVAAIIIIVLTVTVVYLILKL